MYDLIKTIFSTGNFEPHSEHFINYPELMWFLIIGNIIIAILYFLMPFELLYVFFKRKDFPFRWVFFAVPLFGFWCSATHIVMVISFWYPLYYLQGVVDLITGVVSFITFLTFVPASRNALKLLSPTELQKMNDELNKVVKVHREDKARLSQKNLELSRVSEVVSRKNEELTRLNRYMINQELRMIDLKNKIRDL